MILFYIYYFQYIWNRSHLASHFSQPSSSILTAVLACYYYSYTVPKFCAVLYNIKGDSTAQNWRISQIVFIVNIHEFYFTYTAGWKEEQTLHRLYEPLVLNKKEKSKSEQVVLSFLIRKSSMHCKQNGAKIPYENEEFTQYGKKKSVKL